METDHNIEVLLSTYNGERYLREQLASIESQSVGGLTLSIRDDGSTDGTLTILDEYSAPRDWVSLHRGENCGVMSSFMWLLDSVSDGAEWVAFCDQDDVWYASKLERAIAVLKEYPTEIPAMYFSSVRLVDESRFAIGKTSPCRREPGFLNALTQNVATGCTIVLNRAAVDILSKREVGSSVAMHDWWAYLVVSAFGIVVCDDEPSMDYRQHSGNVVGASRGLAHWVQRLARFRKRSRRQLVQYSQELLRVYGDELPRDRKAICEEFVNRAGSSSLTTRLWYVLAAPIYRQTVLDDFLMRVMISLGWR